MMWRLREMPRYSTDDSTVEARHYNRIRLALQRLPDPIRLKLIGIPHLDIVIDNDSWVCVDTSLNDLPVIAWTDFDTTTRQGLHQPIQCKLHYFHYKAGLLVLRALNITEALLAERLAHPPVCQLPSKKRRGTERGGLHVVL
jgi:hypothetical protein